jgi:hypothetical protein
LAVLDQVTERDFGKREGLILALLAKESFGRARTRAYIPRPKTGRKYDLLAAWTRISTSNVSQVIDGLKARLVIWERPESWYAINVNFGDWRVALRVQSDWVAEQGELDVDGPRLDEALLDVFVASREGRFDLVDGERVRGNISAANGLGASQTGYSSLETRDRDAGTVDGQILPQQTNAHAGGSVHVSGPSAGGADRCRTGAAGQVLESVPESGTAVPDSGTRVPESGTGCGISPHTPLLGRLNVETLQRLNEQEAVPESGTTVPESGTRAGGQAKRGWRSRPVTWPEERRLLRRIGEFVGDDDIARSAPMWVTRVIRNIQTAVIEESVSEALHRARTGYPFRNRPGWLMTELARTAGVSSWGEVAAGPEPFGD